MAETRKRVPRGERKMVSLDRLKELIHYDSETGVFTRISAPRPQAACYIGKPVGYIKRGAISNGGGYVIISVDAREYRAHQLAWFYMTGEWPVADVDHRDTDRTNNRWGNLRAATRAQNIANARTPHDNRSGIKGVRFDVARGKWVAQLAGKYLGGFKIKDDAAEAYRTAAVERYGDFARFA